MLDFQVSFSRRTAILLLHHQRHQDLSTSFTAANGGDQPTSSSIEAGLKNWKWLITNLLLRNLLPHCLQATCDRFSSFSFPRASISTVFGIDSIVGDLHINLLNSKFVKVKMLPKKSSLLQLDLFEEISAIATWFAWRNLPCCNLICLKKSPLLQLDLLEEISAIATWFAWRNLHYCNLICLKKSPLLQLDLLEEIATIATWFAWRNLHYCNLIFLKSSAHRTFSLLLLQLFQFFWERR